MKEFIRSLCTVLLRVCVCGVSFECCTLRVWRRGRVDVAHTHTLVHACACLCQCLVSVLRLLRGICCRVKFSVLFAPFYLLCVFCVCAFVCIVVLFFCWKGCFLCRVFLRAREPSLRCFVCFVLCVGACIALIYFASLGRRLFYRDDGFGVQDVPIYSPN